MLALTLAQMRRSIGRLAAAGIAIAIGTAFVAATFLASGVLERTALDAMTASYADTDLVVSDGSFAEADVATIAEVPGVALAEAPLDGYLQLQAGGRQAFLPSTPVAGDPRLRAQEIVAGALPQPGELALPEATAERLELAVGDTVTALLQVYEADPATDEAAVDQSGTWVEEREDLLVSGLVSDPAGAFAATGGAAVVAPTDALRWHELADAEGTPPQSDRVLILLDPGTDPTTVQNAIAATVADDGAIVRTRDEQAEHLAQEVTGETGMLTALTLGFAAIALIVASLVITNTFSVLVAQRTRSLALLRCIGATTRQLRRSVTLEALILGIGSSLIGIASGVGLAQAALAILNTTAPDIPLPGLVTITPVVLIVPLVMGTLVTLVAALAPARAASRVAPLAAMRPPTAPTAGARASRWRLLLAAFCTLAGIGLLVLGMVVAPQIGVLAGLAAGVLGGLLSILGVLVGAVFWVPRLVGAAGALLSRATGPTGKLAAANIVRNPQRTAVTSSALLIGVTLVAMMSTGAATARTSLDHELDLTFPVDMTVQSLDGSIGQAQIAEVAALPGVEAVAGLGGAAVVIANGSQSLAVDARIVDPAQARDLVHTPELLTGFAEGTILLPGHLAEQVGITDEQAVTLSPAGPDGAPLPGSGQEVVVRVTDLMDGVAMVPTQTGAALATDDTVSITENAALWIRMSDSGDPVTMAAEVQEVFTEQAVAITGAAVERAAFASIINGMLLVVVGLLGVAVVIALIGVANTLSLSVIERRRESATLRAIGLTRRQLRQSLAYEGLLIAGSGAVIGSLLGPLYGWAGARTVLGAVSEGVTLAIPWRDLGLVLVVALLAGLAASVLPGRSAARTSPVAALAAE